MMTDAMQQTLTQASPSTRMGALFRRYWLPLLPCCDLEPGKAHSVRILGEDLVVFRQPDDSVAVLEEHCPHRRASLALGCIESDGIRCPYHGWKFDAEGNCLEMPGEPEDTPLLKKIKTTSYPAQELGGMIFIYMGPQPVPLLPRFDLFVWDNALRDIGIAELPCNWLQIMENSVDPVHVEWLHGKFSETIRNKMGQSTPPAYKKHHVKIGFDVFEYGIIKRRILEKCSETDDDWSVGHPLIFPNIVRIGSNGQHVFQIRVPIDDVNTRHFWYSCYRSTQGKKAPHQKAIPSFTIPWRNDRGEYIVDTVPGQDAMIWVSQGPITDRTREHLSSSDRGIAILRKLLLQQLEMVEKGEDPIGIIRNPDNNTLIELPHESDRLGGGAEFLADVLSMGHARYSPLYDQIYDLLINKSLL